MKNIDIRCGIFIAVMMTIFGCKERYNLYESDAGLNFSRVSDTLVNYSFIYEDKDMVQDTIFIPVQTMGNLSDKPRSITITQVTTGNNDAVPGKHYVAFDDPAVKHLYIMPAGLSTRSLPIVIKRDPSLKTSYVTLALAIKPNDDFKLIIQARNKAKVVFTDQLSRPVNWGYYANYIFGKYGPAKHNWLIQSTGHPWDAQFITTELGFTLGGTNANYDDAYISYFAAVIKDKFAAYNLDRQSQGLDVLREADGTAVNFNVYIEN